MADHASVAILQPVPYFPLVRSLPTWASDEENELGRLSASHQRMFYLPKVLKSLDAFWLYRSIINKLQSLHRNAHIDVIDAHFGYPDGVGCYLAARRLGIPFFLTFRGLEADYIDSPLVRPQITSALRHAAGCVCVSGYLRDLAIRYGADAESLRVIHNAVDRALFRPGSRLGARLKLGRPETDPLIVSVGHLAAVKGHHTLLRGFRQLQESVPNAKLAIIGGTAHEAQYPDELVSLANTLGLRNSVAFVGNIRPHEVVDWLRAADVFALATRREGCCNAVLEALATGTPVVTTPAGDNAYFVKDALNGFIVPIGDSDALASGLARALAHRYWDANRISQTLAVGDWAQVGKQVFDFFLERINNHPRMAQ